MKEQKYTKERGPETKYTFRVSGKLKPLTGVRDSNFKLGDIVSTSEGSCQVIEVFWTGDDRRGWKGAVLLKSVKTDARNKDQGPKDRGPKDRGPKSSSKNQKRRNPRSYR